MRTAGLWSIGIVAGGVALGILLAQAARPEMKDAPPQWWQLTGTDNAARVSDVQFAEAWPEDLYVPSGYRPDLDYDAEIWSLPIPEYEMAPLVDEEPVPFADEASAGEHDATDAADAADDAEAAVDEAIAATTPGSETPEVRKSALAKAGLY